MRGELTVIGGYPVFVCPADGYPIASEQDALDLIGDLWGLEVEWLALPTRRLSPEFLRLRSGMAGGIIQKFVNYRVRLAIVGDIAREMAASPALTDFVRESNAGGRVWFVPDMAALEVRLAGPSVGQPTPSTDPAA